MAKFCNKHNSQYFFPGPDIGFIIACFKPEVDGPEFPLLLWPAMKSSIPWQNVYCNFPCICT